MIRFVSDNGRGSRLKVLNAETGEDIGSKLSIKYGGTIVLDYLITAQLELVAAFDVAVHQTKWRTKHPITGDFATPKSITFADGTRVDFTDDGTPTIAPPGTSA